MKSRRIPIVLDKSFLQGCQQHDLLKVVKSNRLLVTAELFYEISSSEELKKCFDKLIPLIDSIDLIDHLGTLIKFEIQKQHSSMPLSQHFLKGKLNPGFNFKFNDGQKKRIDDFGRDHEKDGPKGFEKVILGIREILFAYQINDFKRKNVILDIYNKLRDSSLPPADKLDEEWAIFRRLQIDLLAGKEYLNSYRDGRFNIREKTKAHNQIDFRICVLALLSKGIATNDKLIKKYFKFFCPDGIIYSLG